MRPGWSLHSCRRPRPWPGCSREALEGYCPRCSAVVPVRGRPDDCPCSVDAPGAEIPASSFGDVVDIPAAIGIRVFPTELFAARMSREGRLRCFRPGIHARIAASFNASRYQAASYPRSPSSQSTFGRLLNNARVPMSSLTWPFATNRLSGRPWLSQMACSFAPLGDCANHLPVSGSCRPWCGPSDVHAPLFHAQTGRCPTCLQAGRVHCPAVETQFR